MMFLASYDWRLSYHNLEVRDNFFTKLKTQIEIYKKIHGKKTVVMAHSMGMLFCLLKILTCTGLKTDRYDRLHVVPILFEMG
jgi:alpha-beta hydrolase superfamily lysophospholipase